MYLFSIAFNNNNNNNNKSKVDFRIAWYRYFAVARGGEDGHSFAFSALDNSKGTMQGGGCERPCMDLEHKVCGCIDTACTGPLPKGEEHNRRWAVYELVAPSRK